MSLFIFSVDFLSVFFAMWSPHRLFSAVPAHKGLKLWSCSIFFEQTLLVYWEGAYNDIYEGVKLLDGQFYRIFHRGDADCNRGLIECHHVGTLRRKAQVVGWGAGFWLTLWSLPTNLKTGAWKCFARWSRDVYCFTESSDTQLKVGQGSE